MKTLRALLVASVTVLLVAVGTQSAQAKSPYSVTATTSSGTTSVGGSFVISGKVSPAADGSKVSVQRRTGRASWTTVATATLSGSSTYSSRVRPTTGGPTSYRVVKASSTSRAAGYSPTRTVDVFRWRYLTDLPVEGESGAYLGAVNIKGNTFDRSVSIYGNPPQWDIATPACTKFRSFIGVDDDSPAGTTADTKVILDFATESEVTIAETPLGDLARGKYPQYVQELIPAGHTDIIFVGGANTHGAPGTGYLTYGSPQVYCNS